MIYKCKKCHSEDNDLLLGEWCGECEDFRELVMPLGREYTPELILEKYLADMCPVCDGKVNSDGNIGHKEYGGKCMAKYFRCHHCKSEYTVGYMRNSYPVESEITYNAIYKD